MWLHWAWLLLWGLVPCMAIYMCVPGYCDNIDCIKEVPEKYRPPCGTGQKYYESYTYCSCCDACVDIREEGEACSYTDYDFMGGLDFLDDPPNFDECAERFECKPVKKDFLCVDPAIYHAPKKHKWHKHKHHKHKHNSTLH